MNDKTDSGHANPDDILKSSDAEAASPIAESIAGEEDPGSALEAFMKEEKD